MRCRRRSRARPSQHPEILNFKYLGLSINADQRLKIDMFAADAYKERHGKLPSKKLYRGIPASIYPAADVDTLDSFTKGMVKRG
jgi:hypothetical protein